eukprot:Lithocolla_globosa_v1_NODE_6997_length_1006_cov_3.909569.p1 type:complete len:300 gc:universal NODE_6997_length_1006_cov_3.909569:49-948(+)
METIETKLATLLQDPKSFNQQQAAEIYLTSHMLCTEIKGDRPRVEEGIKQVLETHTKRLYQHSLHVNNKVAYFFEQWDNYKIVMFHLSKCLYPLEERYGERYSYEKHAFLCWINEFYKPLKEMLRSPQLLISSSSVQEVNEERFEQSSQFIFPEDYQEVKLDCVQSLFPTKTPQPEENSTELNGIFTEELIYLTSSDGENFSPPFQWFRNSEILSYLQTLPGVSPIVLPFPSSICRLVLVWAKHHANDLIPEIQVDEEFRERRTDDILEWDLDFMKVDQGTIFEIILVANFLKLKPLLD